MGKDYTGTATQKNKVYVRLPALATDTPFEVVLSSGALSDHVGMMACSTVIHRQVEPQQFSYDAESGLIVQLGKSPQMCVTVGRDKEPDSQTPALEMQPCNPKDAHAQRWNYTAAGQLALALSPKKCMDTDSTDQMLEVYSCHAAGSAGNQVRLQLGMSAPVATAKWCPVLLSSHDRPLRWTRPPSTSLQRRAGCACSCGTTKARFRRGAHNSCSFGGGGPADRIRRGWDFS